MLVLEYKHSLVYLKKKKVTTAMFVSEQRMKHFRYKGAVFIVIVFKCPDTC